MLPLLLAGGIFVAAPAPVATPEVETINHTLKGEKVLAKEVVCRTRWGTPMLPDGKGGYNLISPINEEFIALSLYQPPKSRGVPFRPATVDITIVPELSAPIE